MVKMELICTAQGDGKNLRFCTSFLNTFLTNSAHTGFVAGATGRAARTAQE